MPFSQIGHNDGVPLDVTRQLRIEGNLNGIAGNDVWNDVWDGDAVIIPEPPSTGVQLAVKSSSIDDTLAGSGTQRVRLSYLNTSDELTYEDIDLNGQTLVNTVATDITDVIDFHAIQIGTTNGVSAGDIDVVDVGDTEVYCRISENGNKAMSTLRHLLPTSTFYLSNIVVSGDTKGVDVILRSDSTDDGEVFDGVWLFAVPITLSDAPAPIEFKPALKIPPGARIKLSARGANHAAAKISAVINGWVKI